MTDKKQDKELRTDNLVKIPYFDEKAAQDYLDMCNGGHLDWSTDENKERLGKIIGEIEAEVGGGINVLAMLKAAFQGKGEMGYSSIVSKVVDSKLQNTLLTDYLARANRDDNVYKFESITVAPYPNSFTMYKMFSSYLTIVPKEQMPIDMEKLNQAVLGERGYYEMIADDGNEKSILRFNINAFRNNYNLADSQEYAGVREHVILNFANFLAKMDVKNIYLHNPPLQISEQIKRLYPDTIVEVQEYKTVTEETIKVINENYNDIVIGQSGVKTQLLKALLPLTLNDREKPVVMLFYGSSGIGKTETANFISTCLEEKIFRKQFSMFQNNQFSTYLFGGAHYEKSFAKDLLDRESNVILLDEFDKAHPIFHSAFYQLFDEGIFEDQNYIVQLKKSVIICTSNYRDEDEIRKELGDAIFNRFDVVIGFNELSEEAKLKIAERSISVVQIKYKQEKNMEMAEQYLDYLKKVAVKCRNAREIHHLVSDTFALYYIKQVCGDCC